MTSEIRTNSLTSRAGLSTVTLTDSGPMFSGITTFVDNSTFSVGTGGTIHAPATNTLNIGVNNTESLRIDSNSNLKIAGVCTATHFYGNGSNLTGISAGTSLSGSTNNTICTVTGANAIQGEANLTYDGNNINLAIDNSGEGLRITASGNHYSLLKFDSNASSAGGSLCNIQGHWNGTEVANIIFAAGDDTSNKDDGYIRFLTTPSGGSSSERLRITSEGYLFIRDNGVQQTNTTLSYQSEGAFITHYVARTTAGGDRYRRMLDIASVGANPHGSSIRLLTSADSTNPAVTVERVRIDHNGRVGINKSTPQTMLSIKAERSDVPRFGIDGHYSDSSYTQTSWDDSNGLYTLLGVNHKHDANGNDATPISSLHSASIMLDGRSGNIRFNVKPDSGTTITEVMRISDNGVVSIGSPYSQGGANPQLSMYGSSGRQFKIMNSGANTTSMQLQNSTTGYGEDAGIQIALLGGGTGYLTNQYAGTYAWEIYQKQNGGSHKHIMRVYREGKIGQQTDTDNLMLSNSQDGSGSNYFLRGSKNSTTPGGGNDVVWIYEDGDLRNANNSYGQQSDIKLKENIVDANSQWDDIKKLKVRNFNFKASTGFDTHTQIGLIAQEAELVSPGLVKEVKDRVKTEEISEVDGSKSYNESLSETEKTKHVMYSVLYMKAIKALQEAMTRIEVLEQDNITLRARITNLEGQ